MAGIIFYSSIASLFLIPMSTNSKYSWLAVGIATIAVSAIGALTARRSQRKQLASVDGESLKVEVLNDGEEPVIYTQELKQAPWAPPAWLFGPAWTFNNYFLLRSLQQLVTSPENFEDKKKLLYLQAGIWGIFFSFGHVYFKKKSPVLAAVWTIADAALAALSFQIAHRKNKKLSYLYLPLLAWTSFASTVASYQAAKNPDPLLKTNAILN